jgi:hypothetical protein
MEGICWRRFGASAYVVAWKGDGICGCFGGFGLAGLLAWIVVFLTWLIVLVGVFVLGFRLGLMLWLGSDRVGMLLV